MQRVGLVVHPRRELGGAIGTVEAWAGERGADVVQVRTPGSERAVAPPAAAADCDLLLALGGDGTTLAALRAAAPAGRPVLGVACGSLGALTAVTAADLRDALDEVAAGRWEVRRLPALRIEEDGGEPLPAVVNDLVLVRRGAGQVIVSVHVDGELYARVAGDGLVVATPLGSSAYTLAAGGPVLAPGTLGMAVTPLAPHGGCSPPLVTGPEATLAIELDPGHGGARLEGDGQIALELERQHTRRFTVSLLAAHAQLVVLGDQEPMLAGLRRRRVIIDSPRLLARDDRAAARPYD